MKSKFFQKSIILVLVLPLVLVTLPAQGKEALSTSDPPETLSTLAQTSPTAPESPAAPSCDASPFGNVLTLFGEQEVFIGVSSTHPDFDKMPVFGLDRDPVTGQIHENHDIDNTPNGNLPMENTGAAADLDGDGKTEFIQSFVNVNGDYYVSRFNPNGTISSFLLSNNLHANLAIAGGNLFGENSERGQAVLASVNQNTGAITVVIWDGTGGIDAVWRSTVNDRANATMVDVAVGNFNNNNKDDIALAFLDNSGDIQVVVLEYDAAHQEGVSGSPNFEDKLADLATWSVSTGTPMDIQVTTARLNNDLLDEIVIAHDIDDVSSSLSPDIHLRVLYLYENQLFEQGSMAYTVMNTQSFNFALASGDMNGNYRQEVVVAYDTNGGVEGNGLAVEVLQGQGLNSPDPTLGLYGTWFKTWDGERDQARYLDAGAGDLDRDGYAEILLSLDDGRGLEVLYLTNDLLGTNNLPFGHQIDLDATDLNGPTALALGDWDNDSLKGVFVPNSGSQNCRSVIERRITAAVFTPPYWENIQLSGASTGTIGKSYTEEQSEQSSYTYERSHALSGFVGLGVSAEYGLAKFESNVRVTAKEEYSQSETHGSGTYTSTTTTVVSGNEYPFVTAEESHYDCYSYEVQQNGAPVTDTTSIRNCEYISSDNITPSLPAWETSYGPKSPVSSANEALGWMPVARDWANLALFRRDFVTQSSGGSINAALAVDGDLSGVPVNMTATAQENNPWWEVDLGQSETLSKIRLWGLEDRTVCQDRISCPAMLTDVYVFVSDSPFTSTDPTVLLNDNAVFHASLAEISPALPTITETHPTGRVTTLQTLDGNFQPVSGRYVRVQIARGNAILSLAEVQLFGTGHVEPDRYPIAVQDPVADDGYFQVQLFDPYETNQNEIFKWINVRGNLIWDWESGLLDSMLIGPGNSYAQWDFSEETGNSQISSQAQSHNTTVGVEFDLTAGIVAQVQIGGGYEVSSGITQENAFTTSWGDGFLMGGKVYGFPGGYIDQSWALDCRYKIKPYLYQLIEESSFGVTTNFNVLDYFVPDVNLARTADLENCLNGNQAGAEPIAAPDTFEMTANGATTMSVIANDVGNGLIITNVTDPANGTATFDNRTITYTPNSGFVGEDTLTYTISDGTTTSEGTVTIVVDYNYIFLPVLVK